MIAALALFAPLLGCQFDFDPSKTPSSPIGALAQKAIAAEGGRTGALSYVHEGRSVPMPLERTVVNADIAGMGARVTVVQTFVNPSPSPIEAVYTFPLPEGAAVDRMRIRVGSRIIEGEIRRREEARQIYETAKSQGKAAALLDKETGDVFTQSVANIRPGEKIEVEISYVELLKFEKGDFEFVFPMVVGPRYLGAGTKDPGKLNPPRVPPGLRSGQDVDVNVHIHGGAPIAEFNSILHEVKSTRRDPSTVEIALAKKNEIPNRDFILRYRTARSEVQESLLTHWDEKTGGHFALVLAPPAQVEPQSRAPREFVFVMDQSGSQQGFPIEKSKELTFRLMSTLRPGDRFNVLGFSDVVNPLWPGPRTLTPENLEQARGFVRRMQASGGTQLEKAVVASLSPPTDPERVRFVLFNTDGLAGQQETILRSVRQFRGTSRLFTFGIGNSVNRGLISAMSREGRGADEVVTLASDADAAVSRLTDRLESPVLVNPQATFEGGNVEGIVPNALPDVFSTKPVVLYGRYSRPGRTRLILTGRTASGPWRREIDVNLPATEGDGSSIASLWARAKIADLQSESYAESILSDRKLDITPEIVKIALAYRLVTEGTSFVAVARDATNPGGQVQSIRVPVAMPDGMSERTMPMSVAASPPANGVSGGGIFGGASAAAPAAKRSAGGRSGGAVPDSIDYVTFDPAHNSLIVREENAGTRTVRIEEELLKAKGDVDLRVVVKEITKARIEKLRRAGLKVEIHDGETLVFGVANAKQIREIAKLDFVLRIARLRVE